MNRRIDPPFLSWPSARDATGAVIHDDGLSRYMPGTDRSRQPAFPMVGPIEREE